MQLQSRSGIHAFVPTYYFDLYNDMDVIDDEGQDLPDLEAAKAHALAEARTMIEANVAETGRVDLTHRMEVRDESGETVHSLRFEDAVRFVREGRPV
jgi:hypothetical protein